MFKLLAIQKQSKLNELLSEIKHSKNHNKTIKKLLKEGNLRENFGLDVSSRTCKYLSTIMKIYRYVIELNVDDKEKKIFFLNIKK